VGLFQQVLWFCHNFCSMAWMSVRLSSKQAGMSALSCGAETVSLLLHSLG
jgi:hypothetical protein